MNTKRTAVEAAYKLLAGGFSLEPYETQAVAEVSNAQPGENIKTQAVRVLADATLREGAFASAPAHKAEVKTEVKKAEAPKPTTPVAE